MVFTAWVSVAVADYPDKLIRITASSPAGGGTDIIGRVIDQKVGEEWGQNVVVENRPGASEIIGSEIAAKALADIAEASEPASGSLKASDPLSRHCA